MTTVSPLDTINQVIRESNPFESQFVVKSQHVWDEGFPDVASLHKNASDVILNAIEKLNAEKSQGRTTSFVILAPKGFGKTHVFSRIRQRIKQQKKGSFIYICEYGNLSLIKCQFLQALATSLKKTGGQGVMQWQELAAALINQALGKSFLAQQLITQFPKVLAQKPGFIDLMTDKIAQMRPEIDNPYILRAIIWTLSQTHAAFAISWLAGRELSDIQAKLMGLPNPNKADRESDAFSTACQILNLISTYTTPVICFDELDGAELADEDDPMLGGFTRAQVVASLEKDIYNNLRHGILISGMYARTWNDEFQAAINMIGAAKDRIAHEKLELTSLKADGAIDLVSTWLTAFYSQHNLTPPHLLYPFEESQIREVGEGASVRDVLQWCARNFANGIDVDPIERLEKIYQVTEFSLEDCSDDNQKIAAAIAFGLKHLKGQTIEGVTLQDLDPVVKPKSGHNGFINFRILGIENEKPVKIGVCVCQNSNGNSVKAAVKYLNDYKSFDLTRGCLIRGKDIPKHWKVANTYLQTLLNEKGGEWVPLKMDTIRPILTLHQMSKELDRDIFSDEVFLRFIEEKYPLSENPLIREILSDPSGQAPEEVIDEDAELERLLSESIDLETPEETEFSELLSVA